MTTSQGFRLKYGKETVADSGERMIATKLVVNVKIGFPSEERSKIRAVVNSIANNSLPTVKSLNRASGKIAYMTQYHPSEGKALRTTLESVRRHLSEVENRS